jgi:hypothetical protein
MCQYCHAPGVYHSQSETLIFKGYQGEKFYEWLEKNPQNAHMAEQYKKGWPGVCLPMTDPRIGQSVGTICPNCGSPRPGPKKLQTKKVKGKFW